MKESHISSGTHEGMHVVDVNQGFYSLYVYCNTIEPRPVGDTEVPLLHIVPIEAILDQGGVIELNIDGAGDDYLDLYNTYIYVEAKVVQRDGTPLPKDAPVAPVNLMLHSMLSQVDVSLHEKLATPLKNTYPYRAYLETLLSYGQEAKSSQLTTALWYKDTATFMDSVKGNDNKGLMKCRAKAQESKLIDMVGKVHVDLMFQEKYILMELVSKCG